MTGSRRRVLLDTSMVIASFRQEQAIQQRIATVQAVITATVLGELYTGAYRAANKERELWRILTLIASSDILDCDQYTADQYGRIRQILFQQGSPIPDNDIWIAASALEHDLPLATRDAHFERVPGLVVERW